MTESKPSTPSRIIRPSIVPAALGHSYASTAPYQLARPKLSQVTQSSVTATSVSPSTITHTSQTSAGTAQLKVSVPLVGPNKEALTVVTSYAYIPKSNCTGQRTAVHPSNASAEKLPLPVTLTSAQTPVRASVKNIGIQRVNVKQVAGPLSKALVSGSPAANIVQPSLKKDSDPGKLRHFLVGAGLRQPLKPYQHQVTGEILRVAPRSTHVHTSSWALNQQDYMKASTSSPSLARTKPPFQNAAPHDLSKKHTISQQPKTTISITPHIPSNPSVYRGTTLPVAPISSGNKSIYQVLTPTLQTVHGDIIKNIPMIVSQAIALPVSNSPSSSTAFVPSSSALSTGQITVMTCGSGIAYVPAPTPLSGASNSIPIAKVYPQQQPNSRPSAVSTASGRLTVPVISSVNASSTQRTTPALIHVGPVKSTPATSIVMTQTTIMSTTPIAVNKSVTNSGMGSVLCWSTFSQPLPASMVTSASSLRPSLALSSTPTQQSLPGTIRVQPYAGNVLLVENPKSGLLQGTGGSASVLPDTRSGSSSTGVTNQPGVGPTTPTMSPKPAILRRPRPENSGALKKLSFPTAIATQRRDLRTKPNERRPVPYTLTRPKIGEDAKTNVPVFIQHRNSQGDKIEAKPVLENQVLAKQLGPGSSVTSLKLVNSLKSHSSFSNPAKPHSTQSYSIHPIADLKVKGESGFSAVQQNSVKSEPASASQMLQFQHQSMHTYAAESPNTISNMQHHIISQASGHHTTSHTMFTNPGSLSIYPSQQSSRPKPAQVIKAATSNSANPQSQAVSPIVHSSHGVNSFPPHRTSSFAPDSVKKEHSRIKPLPGLEQAKQPGEGTLLKNYELTNHLLSAVSPAKSWLNVNSTDSLAGLSPRKRPRKQTHVVSEDQSVVMEDEESTDDADECEDEPMPEVANLHPNVSTTPTAKLPGHKSSVSHRPIKSESHTNNKSVKDEKVYKASHVKSEAISTDSKPPSEYTDRNGVRYVISRKRPAVSVLNRLKPNSRSIANHFMHYSDLRVKDKKTTIADLTNDKGRLKGMKVARLALQLQDMVECEKDVRNRMQVIHDGLVSYKSTLVGDATFDGSLASPSPGTPSSLLNSFRKATPRSSRSSSMSAINESEPMQSPSTPLDRKAHKVKDEILNIEELAQANLQRCRVVSDQLADIKTMLLKSVDHRQLVTDILESSSNRKMQSQSNPQTTKRLSKKKNTS